MSWLEDLKYTYKYDCESCGHTSFSESESEVLSCEECSKDALYSGFIPQKLGITTQVEYEQNGRKAMAIRGKDGEMSYVSKTRLNYQKTGRIENQYTDSYKNKLQEEQQYQMLKSDTAKGKGKATAQNHMEDMVKNLPDGEYLSDGEGIVGSTEN